MSTIFVEAETLPEAWEKAVCACWRRGARIATQYDKPGDPASRDCMALIVVDDPMSEPRIHRAFPGSLEDLWVYREEVVSGVHDDWIKPEEGKWSYTYHQRLMAYPLWAQTHNQIARVIEQLVDAPHTRRAQAITWIPHLDQYDEHAPCVQRVWFRIFDDRLHMHLHIRSNDAFKAGFMNMFAMIELQAAIAAEVGARVGRPIAVGPYKHVDDSWHIYGSYFNEFKGFLDTLEHRTFAERVWCSDEEIVQSSFDDAKRRLAAEQAALSSR